MGCHWNRLRVPILGLFYALPLADFFILSLGPLQAKIPTAEEPAARQATDGTQLAESPPKIDPALPLYAPSLELTGTLSAAGADALNAILENAFAEFAHHHSKVRFYIKGKGGATAPPHLLENTVDFGMMTRRFSADEMKAFVERQGHEPTFLLVAWEVLAIWVHQDNPITSLTLPELDAIYSHERKRGHPRDLTNWGQLELDGSWSERPISLHGPSTATFIFGQFVRTALEGGRPRAGYIEHAGTFKMLQAVAERADAIGVSSVRFRAAGVRAVPIVTQAGGKPVPPESSLAADGNYPLAAPFYLVVNKKPGQPLAPLPAEFLQFLYGRAGQVIVAHHGYTPMSAALAQAELQKVGLSP